MNVKQTKIFARQKKRLHANQVGELDLVIKNLIIKPDIGEQKKGDLNLENAVESRLPAQHLDSSSYLKNLLITNKGTTQFLSTLSKTICYTG